MTSFKVGDMVMQKPERQRPSFGHTDRAKGLVGRVAIILGEEVSSRVVVDFGLTFGGHTARGELPTATGRYYYASELQLLSTKGLEGIGDDYKLLYE